MTYLANLGQLIREVFSGSKREGSFSQNYLAVLSGTGVNILVQIFVSPLLTRIYGPEGYGIYALYNALCTNIALLATLRFPQAFLLPKEDKDFFALMRMSFISAFGFSAVIFTVLFVNGHGFLKLLHADGLFSLMYFIPLGVFLIALNQIFGQWQYRLSAFKKSVVIDTSLLVGVRIFNLAFGWSTHGMRYGLILGDILGKISGLVLSAKLILKQEFANFFTRISLRKLKEVFLTYKAYPFINLPGVWLVVTSEQLPFFLLSSRFGVPALGLLALSISILDLPKRLFAYSVSSVFYKKAVDLHADSLEQLQASVGKMFYGLLLLSAVPYSVILIFGPELFSFVFGPDWIISGRLGQYLALYYVLELICISFDSLFYILRKERQLFYFQVSAFAGRLVVLLFGIQFLETLEQCIFALVIFNVVLYTTQLFCLLNNLKLPVFKFLLELFGLLAIVVFAFFGLKIALSYMFDLSTTASVFPK
jgi:O-antigen/teichoic acid export membrane protein